MKRMSEMSRIARRLRKLPWIALLMCMSAGITWADGPATAKDGWDQGRIIDQVRNGTGAGGDRLPEPGAQAAE